MVQNFERIALMERIKTLRSTIVDCKNVKRQLLKVKQYLDDGGQADAVQNPLTDLMLRVKRLTESADLFPNGCNESLSHLVALDFSDVRLNKQQFAMERMTKVAQEQQRARLHALHQSYQRMQNEYRLAQEMRFACRKAGTKGKLLAQINDRRKTALSKGPCNIKGLINQKQVPNHASTTDLISANNSDTTQRTLVGVFTSI